MPRYVGDDKNLKAIVDLIFVGVLKVLRSTQLKDELKFTHVKSCERELQFMVMKTEIHTYVGNRTYSVPNR